MILRLSSLPGGAGWEHGTHRRSPAGVDGANHSSGVIYQGPEPGFEEFWGITDTPTGISYGGGIGLEVGPYSRIRFLLQGNIWMDNAYGSAAFDPDVLFGVGVDL